MTATKKLSIVMPAYNEGKTIHLILDRLRNVELMNGFDKEIIIVNDCSNDNTETVIQDFIKQNSQLNIHYFRHERNAGKGAAIQTGISKATGDYVIIQDADLEYDPDEYNI